MRIAFVCGSLEPGRDGVGDYTRRLGTQLQELGWEVRIIATHDPGVVDETVGTQGGGRQPVPVHRLPQGSSESARLDGLRGAITAFDPAWISLQFVPYSFHPKGLYLTFANSFASVLSPDVKVHIMFHELWADPTGGASLGDRMVGQVQRALLRRLLTKVSPSLVTTSNELYARLLPTDPVHVLSLFGNILLASPPERVVEEEILRAVYFGGFPTQTADFHAQLAFVATLAERSGSGVVLDVVGIGGPAKAACLALVAEGFPQFALVDHGPQPQAKVSALLYAADLGLSRADRTLVGKSGSTIAMIEHGLPVVLRGQRGEVTAAEAAGDELAGALYFASDAVGGVPPRHPPASRLPAVADRLVGLLIARPSPSPHP